MSTVLTAINTKELKSAHGKMSVFLTGKINTIRAEEFEIEQAVIQATKNKWAAKALKRALSRIKRRVIYYQKLLDAVNAGYQVIPSFWNAEWFAVRTDKAKPNRQLNTSNTKSVAPSKSGTGEGQYVDTSALREYHDTIEVKNYNGKMVEHDRYIATEFDDVELPVELVKPELLVATKQAMDSLIFDRIGIVKSTADPFIVGQIEGDNYREVYFLLAWYLDVDSL